MIQRVLGVGALALILAVGVAGAAAPEGPRLAVVRLMLEPTRLELLTVDPNGSSPVRISGGGRGSSSPLPYPDQSPSWRPSGGGLAFDAVVGGVGREELLSPNIFLASADGSGAHQIAKTANGQGAVFAPDGHTMAFTRFRRRAYTVVNGKVTQRGFTGATIWTLDLVSGAQHRLTPWRNGLEYVASSFSPDGSTLLATRHDYRHAHKFELVALSAASGRLFHLGIDGLSPVYSPDGSEIVLVRQTRDDSDLYIVDADGANVRRLTRTPRQPEFFPSWDPSGERLAYIRYLAEDSETAIEGIGDSLMQINADGTCQTKLLSAPRTAFYVPAWQPGSGREAGRIDC